jgi:putative membrane protein insertion efficiency factor
MLALQEETDRSQRGLSAPRPAVRSRRVWVIWIATVVLATAAICDWTQPPRQQISVALYQRLVLGGYRLFLKPLADRMVHCRFEPTCSHYSEEAMLAHGFPKGLWLTTSRLFRCRTSVPPGTHDPVPGG